MNALKTHPNPNDHYIVEGLMHPNHESDRDVDGQHPPFMIFMPGPQDHLPGIWRTRAEADAVAQALNEAALDYRAYHPYAHVGGEAE